jgi:hypothetical protein
MLDVRYIYLGRTTANSRLVKIGITKDVEARWQNIDRSVQGSKEYPIASFRVLNAAWLETQLKRKYARRRKPFKGSGKSEWFSLGVFARMWLYFTIAAHGIIFFFTTLAVAFCVIITLLAVVV